MPEENTSSFPRRRESIAPLSQCPRKILRHSREGGNPSPHYLNARRKYSVIPAKAGIHRPTIPMPEENTPSFPRRRESIAPLSQCPRKILRHSREGGNPSPHYLNARGKYFVIPAKAGIHRPTVPMPEENTPSFPRRQESIAPLSQCPRKILRHSREGGNPSPHYLNARGKYSVIPAKAGIHIPPRMQEFKEFNENTVQTDQAPHSCAGLPCHSHTDWNPCHSIRRRNPWFITPGVE